MNRIVFLCQRAIRARHSLEQPVPGLFTHTAQLGRTRLMPTAHGTSSVAVHRGLVAAAVNDTRWHLEATAFIAPKLRRNSNSCGSPMLLEHDFRC